MINYGMFLIIFVVAFVIFYLVKSDKKVIIKRENPYAECGSVLGTECPIICDSKNDHCDFLYLISGDPPIKYKKVSEYWHGNDESKEPHL